MILVLVTRGSKGNEWEIGCGALSLPTLTAGERYVVARSFPTPTPRQPVLVTKGFTSFIFMFCIPHIILLEQQNHKHDCYLVTGARNP